MKVNIIVLTLALFISTCFAAQYVFAEGDSCVYKSSSYTDSNGNSGASFTNRDAQNMNRYIRNTSGGGYVYKNYTRLSPNSSKTLPAPQTSSGYTCTLKAPYANLDVSYTANSNRMLPPIIVTYMGSSLDISPIIMREGMRYNVDPILIMTVIKYESGFCASAVSPAGACGLMQLMPGTAAGLGVADAFSPYQNISGGTLYIRRQLDNFGGNVALALAAYNAGPGAVIENGGIPPYAETQSYVSLILSDYLSSAKVAKRRGGAVASRGIDRGSRKVDMISTLSKMKGDSSVNSQPAARSQAPAAQAPSQTLLPVTITSNSPQNLLENRSFVQGNPLENRPSATIPGF